MSEEIQNASTLVPQALVSSIIINGFLGLAMVIAVLFCIGDVDNALAAKNTLGFPVLEIFLQATSSRVGSCLMGVIVAILGICSTVAALATASRMLWSFSRDRGIPFSSTFAKVSLPFSQRGWRSRRVVQTTDRHSSTLAPRYQSIRSR